MRSNRQAVRWMAAAVAIESVAAAAVLAHFGSGQRGTDIALQITARLSFLPFLVAYAGGAAARLSGHGASWLRRHGRSIGLAFAAGHTVHVALVGWLCWIGDAPATGTFVFFGFALFWVYLLALLSIGRLQRALGDLGWRLVRSVGMNIIMYAFATDFLAHAPALTAKYAVLWLPFAAGSLLGPAIWVAAAVRPLLQAWRSPRLGVGA